jgi:hypothetical protein
MKAEIGRRQQKIKNTEVNRDPQAAEELTMPTLWSLTSSFKILRQHISAI